MYHGSLAWVPLRVRARLPPFHRSLMPWLRRGELKRSQTLLRFALTCGVFIVLQHELTAHLLLPEIEQRIKVSRIVSRSGLSDHPADQAHRRVHQDERMLDLNANLPCEFGPNGVEACMKFLDDRNDSR